MLRPFTGAKDAGILPEKSTKRPLDKGVLITFILLLLTGLVVLYAASFYNAQDKGSPLAELYSQMLGVAVGAVGMLVILRIDYRWLARPAVSGSLLLASLILLVLVAIPGVGKMLNGSRRWLRLGPVSFQPSELAKYSMILFMARALSGRTRDVTRFWRGLVPLLIIPGAMFMLILLQPNLSTAGSILIVAAVMVMMAGAKWLHLGALGVAGIWGAVFADVGVTLIAVLNAVRILRKR